MFFFVLPSTFHFIQVNLIKSFNFFPSNFVVIFCSSICSENRYRISLNQFYSSFCLSSTDFFSLSITQRKSFFFPEIIYKICYQIVAIYLNHFFLFIFIICSLSLFFSIQYSVDIRNFIISDLVSSETSEEEKIKIKKNL